MSAQIIQAGFIASPYHRIEFRGIRRSGFIRTIPHARRSTTNGPKGNQVTGKHSRLGLEFRLRRCYLCRLRDVILIMLRYLLPLALLLQGEAPAEGPLSPVEAQTRFRLPAGFRIDLVASEPEIID